MDETKQTNDSYLCKLQSLPLRTIESIFLLILNCIFSAKTPNIDQARKDIKHAFSFFGVIFYHKQLEKSNFIRRLALNKTKVYILERALDVAKSKHYLNNELIESLKKYLKEKKYVNRKQSSLYTKRGKVSKIHDWINSSIRSEALFFQSFEYILANFGDQIQTKWLLNQYAQQIAMAFLRSARTKGSLNITDLDPFLSRLFRPIVAVVLATNKVLGTRI